MNFCRKEIYSDREKNLMSVGLKMFKLLPNLLLNVLKNKNTAFVGLDKF